MANWKQTLNISAEWALAKNHEITPQELARKIADKLIKLETDPFLEEIIDQFEDLAEAEDVTFNDFDYIMAELYNWADSNLVWIKTF
jgi:hypothetical protein